MTQPYYNFLGVEAEDIHDGILIPWRSETPNVSLVEPLQGTLWAVSHRPGETFDFDDYTVLQSLADFVAIALRHHRQQMALRRKESERAADATANELAHQINNPLQSLTNTLYLARTGEGDTEIFLDQAAYELRGLSDLVARLLTVTQPVRL